MKLENRLEIDLVSAAKEFYVTLLVMVGTGMWKLKSRRNREDINTMHTIKGSKAIKDLMQIILNGSSEVKKTYFF